MIFYAAPMLGLIETIFWIVVKMAIAAAISYGVAMLTRKKQKFAKKAGASEFELPTAMTGRAVPHIRGKRYHSGYNVLTPIFNYTTRSKKKDGNTVAYYYHFGLWCGVCRVADGVKQVKAGDHVLWPTLSDTTDEAADGEEVAEYASDAFSIFGGWRREGGQFGALIFMYGAGDQEPPWYVQKYFDDPLPSGRGMFSVVFGPYEVKQTNLIVNLLAWLLYGLSGHIKSTTILQPYYWGTTTYPKYPAFLIKSTDKTVAGDEIWKASVANVGDDDFNPVHAIYELLVDKDVGRGFSTDLIGPSFSDAANTCYTEGYGVSFVFDSIQDDIQTNIDALCDIIDGIMYFDHDNETFELALVRADYDEETLEVFDEDDLWVESFRRPSPGKTPSRVSVLYTDRITNKRESVSEDDLALMSIQGGHQITMDVDHSAFVCSKNVAMMIAAREQMQLSVMPATMILKCLRTMAHLQPGYVVKLKYEPLNIDEMVIRILKVDRGKIGAGLITITAMEDAFGTVYNTFGAPPSAPSGEGDVFVDTTNEIYFSTSIAENGPY